MTASTNKALSNLLRTIDAFRNNATELETAPSETEGYFQPHRFDTAIRFKESEKLGSLPAWTKEDNKPHVFNEPAQINELVAGTVFFDQPALRFLQIVHAYNDGSYLCCDTAGRIHRFNGERKVLIPSGPSVRRKLHPPEGIFAFHDHIFGGYVLLDDHRQRRRSSIKTTSSPSIL